MVMKTDTEFNTSSGAPMAKLLSPMLMIAQWMAPSQIEPLTLMWRCVTGLIVAVGWFFVLKLLRGVVNAVIHGDPFLPENIARLRNIWIIFAVTEVFRMIAIFFMGGTDGTETGSLLGVRLGTWFLIFIIAAISEAFRHGAALRAEQELTI